MENFNKLNLRDGDIITEDKLAIIDSNTDKYNANKTEILSTLDSHTSQLNDIMHNIDVEFPRQDGESNDLARLQRAVDGITGGEILYIPNTLNCGGEITINKPITIKGRKKPIYNNDTQLHLENTGTCLHNTRIKINSSNVVLKNFGMETVGGNGITYGDTDISDISIENVSVRAKSHCYLFESYYNKVENITLINCDSHNATHGFISKTQKVKFINCNSYDIEMYGFGCISDNIPSATNKSLAQDNVFENCYSDSCNYPLVVYSRDYFSTNNSNKIGLDNLKVNIICNNCANGIYLGDYDNSSIGSDKTANTVYNIDLNINERSFVGSNSIEINNCGNLTLNGNITKNILYKKCENLKNNITKSTSLDSIKTESSGETTISIDLAQDFTIVLIKNTVSTQINRIRYPNGTVTNSKFVLLKICDSVSQITPSGNLLLNKILSGNGTGVLLKWANTYWQELIVDNSGM